MLSIPSLKKSQTYTDLGGGGGPVLKIDYCGLGQFHGGPGILSYSSLLKVEIEMCFIGFHILKAQD